MYFEIEACVIVVIRPDKTKVFRRVALAVLTGLTVLLAYNELAHSLRR